MNKRSIKVDFSEVENLKFKCIEYCGKCCFGQLVGLNTTEINAISNYLNKLPRQKIEDYILDWMTMAGKAGEYDEDKFLMRKNTLLNFCTPWGYIECENSLLIRDHMLHSLRPTGRCVFLNPLDRKCFVYPVRPSACRLHPFTESIDDKLIVIYDECPGLGKGEPVDTKRMKEIIMQTYLDAVKDSEIVKKYIEEEGLKIVKPKVKKRKREVTQQDLLEVADEWQKNIFWSKASTTHSIQGKDCGSFHRVRCYYVYAFGRSYIKEGSGTSS